MGRRKSNYLFLLLFIGCLLIAAPSQTMAKSEFPGRETIPLDIAVDLVFVRPLSIAGTALCAGFFVMSLPLTVWTKKRFTKALQILVITPGKYTFVRAPGKF